MNHRYHLLRLNSNSCMGTRRMGREIPSNCKKTIIYTVCLTLLSIYDLSVPAGENIWLEFLSIVHACVVNLIRSLESCWFCLLLRKESSGVIYLSVTYTLLSIYSHFTNSPLSLLIISIITVHCSQFLRTGCQDRSIALPKFFTPLSNDDLIKFYILSTQPKLTQQFEIWFWMWKCTIFTSCTSLVNCMFKHFF